MIVSTLTTQAYTPLGCMLTIIPACSKFADVPAQFANIRMLQLQCTITDRTQNTGGIHSQPVSIYTAFNSMTQEVMPLSRVTCMHSSEI